MLNLKNNPKSTPLTLGVLITILASIIWVLAPGLLVIFAVGLLFAKIVHQKTHNRFLVVLFVVGFIVRIFSSILLIDLSILLDIKRIYMNHSVPHVPFFGDASYHMLRGFWLAKYHHLDATIATELGILAEITNAYGMSLYNDFIGLIYALIGFCPVVINLINCFVGALIPIITYYIAIELFSEKKAQVAAVLTTLFPVLFFISLVSLKDIIIIFFLTICLLYMIRSYKYKSPKFFIYSLVPMLFISALRPSYSILLLIAFAVFVFLFTYPMRWIRKVSMVVIFIAISFLISPDNVSFIVRKTDGHLKQYYLRHISAYQDVGENYLFLPQRYFGDYESLRRSELNPLDNTVLFSGISFLDHAKYVLSALTHFLLEPFVWKQHQSSKIKMFYALMFIWYILLPLVFWEIYLSVKKRESQAIILFLGLLFTGMALTSANIGTVVRHRAMFTPFFLQAGWQRHK